MAQIDKPFLSTFAAFPIGAVRAWAEEIPRKPGGDNYNNVDRFASTEAAGIIFQTSETNFTQLCRWLYPTCTNTIRSQLPQQSLTTAAKYWDRKGCFTSTFISIANVKLLVLKCLTL